MKTFALVLMIGLFAAGCESRHQRPGTCPHRQAPEKAAEQQPVEKNLKKDTGSGQADDVEESDVSGYGNDPGEETQE